MPTRRFFAGFLALAVLFALWRLLLAPPTALIDNDEERKVDAPDSSWDIAVNDSLADDRADPEYNKLIADWTDSARNDVEFAVGVLVVGVAVIVYLLVTNDRPMDDLFYKRGWRSSDS